VSYQHVKTWRRRLKQCLVAAFGGMCGTCGYGGCLEALEFHHLLPSHKDIGISQWRAIASYEKLAVEASKCVMLCANCHREVHAGVRRLSGNEPRLDMARFAAERETIEKEKSKNARVLQSKLAAKRWHSRWDGVDIVELRQRGTSWATIAKSAGVSVTAARKRYAKLTSGT